MPPTFHYLTDVYFEPGAIRQLPEILDRLGIKRPLIVTDPGVVAAGILAQMPDLSSAFVFADVDSNPTETNVERGLERYHSSACDGLIAVGGGSPIDCAKVISVLVTHAPPLERYAFLKGGLERISGQKPAVVAVPTTAGTGSEVGRGALITFRNGRKWALLSPKLIPQASLCDPLLTLGLPPWLTAGSGMDAISHCVETFLSPRWNPVAEAIALDGLERAVKHLRTAVRVGTNVEARSEMLLAAVQGGLTFQKGLGAVHSLSHPLGSLQHRRLHHGTLNAVMLPHVLRFNAEACPEKISRLGETLRISSPAVVPDFFATLAHEIGLPTRLRDLSVPWDEVEAQSQAAFEDHSGATNPKPLSVEVCRELYRLAY